MIQRRLSPYNAALNCRRLLKGARKRAVAVELEGDQPRWLPWTSRLTVAAASYAGSAMNAAAAVAPRRMVVVQARPAGTVAWVMELDHASQCAIVLRRAQRRRR